MASHLQMGNTKFQFSKAAKESKSVMP